MKPWKLAALGAIAFVAVVPLLHIAGPNYHHPIPVRVVHHQEVKPTPYNPYLPLSSPTVQPSPAASSNGRHMVGGFLVRRLLHHTLPHGYGWRPWRRYGIRNPIPWWLR